MEGWHWSLESRRSVLARLSWIEQAATRSRATVSAWMSVAAHGPETDCAWSCAAEDRDLKDLKNPDSNSAPFAPPWRDTRGRRDVST